MTGGRSERDRSQKTLRAIVGVFGFGVVTALVAYLIMPDTSGGACNYSQAQYDALKMGQKVFFGAAAVFGLDVIAALVGACLPQIRGSYRWRCLGMALAALLASITCAAFWGLSGMCS